MTHPVLEHFSRFRVRWAVAGGVAVAALALTAFVSHGGDARTTAGGPPLNIAVVPPVEREVQPGSVMDVGTLNDGFDGRMPESLRATEVDLYAEQPAYVEDERRAPYLQPDYARPRTDPYDAGPYDPGMRDPRMRDAAGHDPGRTYQGRPMSFGFDQPQPDWRAEREARRAALEARDRQGEVRRYSSSGTTGGLAQDSEFY